MLIYTDLTQRNDTKLFCLLTEHSGFVKNTNKIRIFQSGLFSGLMCLSWRKVRTRFALWREASSHHQTSFWLLEWKKCPKCRLPGEHRGVYGRGNDVYSGLPSDVNVTSWMIVENCLLSSGSHLSSLYVLLNLNQKKSSSIISFLNAGWWFITEYHVRPIIHSPWLLLFSPL